MRGTRSPECLRPRYGSRCLVTWISPPPLTPEKKVTPHLRRVSMSAKLPLDLSSVLVSIGLTAVLTFLSLKRKKPPRSAGAWRLLIGIRLDRGRPLAEPNKGQEYEYGKGASGHRKPNPTTREPASSCVSMTNRPRPAGWRR